MHLGQKETSKLILLKFRKNFRDAEVTGKIMTGKPSTKDVRQMGRGWF